MISSFVTRASAFTQAFAGFALLFAADNILPMAVAGYPRGGAWVGQMLGAALIGLATFNHFSRWTLLGGIYGRAVVASNATFYFIAALSLLRSGSGSAGALLWAVTAITVLFALVYVWLLYRGPF